ncbi:MAG: alpha/beta fold hydrolase [Methylotenera sp.]|nr:alpha/beta fold hydrolase [Methylotenera sp.]MDD4926030.1 alpha/beta fold hydrolase [Methylotenera sp.]NOS95836.1 alpha/beta fold hydrolase [Methylotenera sp.]
MQLHHQSLGQGQPLILLHGLFGSGDNWGTVAKHFSQHYQVISVDLRNHGKSPYSASQSYTNMADDLLELCDALSLDRIHLLGHSLGGKVAMQFATCFPEKLEKLIVVDMAMRAYADAHTHLIDAMIAVDLSTLQSRNEVDVALSSNIPQAMVRQFLLMNLIKSDSSQSENNLTWRINLATLKTNYPSLLQAVCENARYEKSCLFIRGEHSDYVQDTDIRQIKTHFANAQFASLPTDHWVHAEQPQAFIDVVGNFLVKS